VEVDIDM